MPVIYELASPEIHSLAAALLRENHPSLVGIKVGVLVKTKLANDEAVPSLKCHGSLANATCRIVTRKRRVQIPYDAEIELDGAIWANLSEPSRRALIDHELTHIIWSKDPETNSPVVDDLGRPKLKMRPDDWITTGFYDVIQRYGPSALELKSVTSISHQAREALDLFEAHNHLPSTTEETDPDSAPPPAST